METNQQDPEQIDSKSEIPKTFIQKNIVGVIVFSLFMFYSFLHSGNLFSMLIDGPIGFLIAIIIQNIFTWLKKLFAKY